MEIIMKKIKFKNAASNSIIAIIFTSFIALSFTGCPTTKETNKSVNASKTEEVQKTEENKKNPLK